jgi:hypothetical protein
MVAEMPKKQGGAPPTPGWHGWNGRNGLPPARIQPECDRLRASMRSVVSNFEQLGRTAHVILLYTLFEGDAALARGSVLQLELCRFRYLVY